MGRYRICDMLYSFFYWLGYAFIIAMKESKCESERPLSRISRHYANILI